MNLRDGLNTYPSSHTAMVRKHKIRGSEKERDGLAVPSLEEQHFHKPLSMLSTKWRKSTPCSDYPKARRRQMQKHLAQ